DLFIEYFDLVRRQRDGSRAQRRELRLDVARELPRERRSAREIAGPADPEGTLALVHAAQSRRQPAHALANGDAVAVARHGHRQAVGDGDQSRHEALAGVVVRSVGDAAYHSGILATVPGENRQHEVESKNFIETACTFAGD